jgi:MFS family permease
MQKGLLAGLTPRNAILTVILLSNAFVWYYCADDILLRIAPAATVDFPARMQILTASFAGLIGAALVGAKLSRKIADKERFLSLWMMSGMLIPLAAYLTSPANVFGTTLLALGFGVSLGIGLPACMEYFSESNPAETRGRLAGMIMLFTGISIVVLGSTQDISLNAQIVTLSAWRTFGLIAFALFKPSKTISPRNKTPSYKDILTNRPFILYFAPWIMFSLVNYLTAPALNTIATEIASKELQNLPVVQNGLIAVTAIIAGFIADTVGRKPVAIAGFASLGLGYAVLGLTPTSAPNGALAFALVFHTIVNGIAWGALLVIFVITIWGELSRNAPSEKFYAIGVTPFFISRFLSFALEDGSVLVFSSSNLSSVFSFSAFFLFLAVLPLALADETLPEKIKKTRELRIYVEKAQEIAQKYY